MIGKFGYGEWKPSRGRIDIVIDLLFASGFSGHVLPPNRMRQAKILVCGISGLSNEICKNLVLAGVGALTIMDNGTVTEEDLGAQFFLRQEDVGKNVCQRRNSFAKVKELTILCL